MTLLAMLALAGDASADPIADIVVNGTIHSLFEGPAVPGGAHLITINQDSLLEATLNDDGTYDINSITFPAPSSTGFTAAGLGVPIDVEIVPQLSGNSMSTALVPPTSADIFITLRVKLRFTWVGQGVPCETGAFTVALSTQKTYTTNGASIAGFPLSSPSDSFRAVASDFAIPAFGSMACDGATNQATLAGPYGVGAPAGDAGMKLDLGEIQ